jgi:hypothetical protein
MNTRKYFLLTAAFVLLAGLGSAMAQKSSAIRLPPELPPEPFLLNVVHVNAIEIADGTVGYDQAKTETTFGYSFLGLTTGAFPGSFTLSMNCTPATPVPGDSSKMTGGAWTLPVYTTSIKGGTSYAGSLYGTVANGKMAWGKMATSAEVYFVLNVDGGTQRWDGARGYATFAGTLFVDEKTGKATLTGDMVFTMLTGQVDPD